MAHLIWLTLYTVISKFWKTNLTKGGGQTLETLNLTFSVQVHFRAELRPENFGQLGCRFQLQNRFKSYIAVLRSKSSFRGGSDEQSVRFNFQRWMLDAELRCDLVIAVGTSLCDTPSTAEALL